RGTRPGARTAAPAPARGARAPPRAVEEGDARGAGAAPRAAPRPAAAAGPGALAVKRLALALALLGALTGGGAVATSVGAGTDGAAPRPAPAPRDDNRAILHALSRLSFGPRPGDLERVRALGLQAWIERQLRPETIDDTATERALADLASLRMSIPEALRAYPRPH